MNQRTLVVVYLLLSTIWIAPGHGTPSGYSSQTLLHDAPLPIREQVWVSLEFLNQLGVDIHGDATSDYLSLSVDKQHTWIPTSSIKWSSKGWEVPLYLVEPLLGNSLNLDGQRYWLPPGDTISNRSPLNFREERFKTATGQTTILSLKIFQFNKHYQLTTLLPSNGIGSLSPLSDMAVQNGVVAALNANFFDPNSEFPIGLLLDNSRLEYEDYASRGAFGVDLFGNLHFLHLDAKAYVQIDGETVFLNGVNRPAKHNELVAITPAYGGNVRLPKLSRIVQLKQGIIQSIYNASVVVADKDSTFLIATGQRQEELSSLTTGDALALKNTLNTETQWPLRMAVGGGPMLLKQGQMVLDPAKESFSQTFAKGRAARSAIGVTQDGTLILMISLRNNTSSGMTFAELARWFQMQGAIHALAFDGGGSASLSFRTGIHWRHLGGTRGIAVGLGLLPK